MHAFARLAVSPHPTLTIAWYSSPSPFTALNPHAADPVPEACFGQAFPFAVDASAGSRSSWPQVGPVNPVKHLHVPSVHTPSSSQSVLLLQPDVAWTTMASARRMESFVLIRANRGSQLMSKFCQARLRDSPHSNHLLWAGRCPTCCTAARTSLVRASAQYTTGGLTAQVCFCSVRPICVKSSIITTFTQSQSEVHCSRTRQVIFCNTLAHLHLCMR
jgi:hypothetical protein